MSSNTPNHSRRYGLYNMGLVDSEIAELEGVTSVAICVWRLRRGLEPNGNNVGGMPISLREVVERFDAFMDGGIDALMEHSGLTYESAKRWIGSLRCEKEDIYCKLVEGRLDMECLDGDGPMPHVGPDSAGDGDAHA